MSELSIKVPQMSEIKEFTNEISIQIGLLIKIPGGFRTERMSEYLERLGVLNSETLINFASKYNRTIDDFVSAVDKSYSFGGYIPYESMKIISEVERQNNLEHQGGLDNGKNSGL